MNNLIKPQYPGYFRVAIDSEHKVIFITKKLPKVSSSDTTLVAAIDFGLDMIYYEMSGDKLSDYTYVDVTNWEYETYEQLRYLLFSFTPERTAR